MAENFIIKQATITDIPLILQFIKELATQSDSVELI